MNFWEAWKAMKDKPELYDELINIIYGAPLHPGCTLSHQTADMCVDLGLAERNKGGDFVATDKGMSFYKSTRSLKELTFFEAWQLMKDGEWVRMDNWPSDVYWYRSEDELYLSLDIISGTKNVMLGFLETDCVDATNWQIVPKEIPGD
ncbi:MAG: hypothetical protein KAS32_08585 [Candidatus Peribacteraceae bacterium]|nr:hypothetical protein [Candidatus Peribacteraceae bacterium]